MVRVGVKYCGGCDPRYRRRAIVERAGREFPAADFRPYSEGEAFDLVLVVCGCMAECFTFACPNCPRDPVWVRAPEEYARLAEALQTLGLRPAFPENFERKG